MNSHQVLPAIPTELASKFKSAQTQITSERKLVSIIFADLSGFTSLSEKLDPERVTEIVNQCFKRLGQAVYEFEGYIDKFMGDCIMALFGAPIAHENDPELAISCALKILKELDTFNKEMNLDLGMSIGINSGMVVAGGVGTDQKLEYTVMGDAVNIAQRLQSAAKRGQILVSKNIVKLCEDKFEFEKLEPVRLKGKEHPVEVYSVLGPKKIELKDRGIRSGYSQLIGRDHELKIISKLMNDSAQGRGQILLLSGEPGVGKSRLKHEMKKMSPNHGLKFFEAKCANLNRETPYFVFINLLQELLGVDSRAEPDVQKQQITSLAKYKLENTAQHLIHDLLQIPNEGEPLTLSGDQRKKATFVAIRNLIQKLTKDSPLVIYLEDLHWIDSVSEELLSSLLDSVPAMPLLLTGGTRPDFAHSWSDKRNLSQISLGPLTPHQSIELVQAILSLKAIPLGLKKLIDSKADGNPLYVEEIVKSLIDSGKIYKESHDWVVSEDVQNVEVPHTLQGIIASRIDRLPENDKLVLQYASIIGRRFSDALLGKAMEIGSSLYESLKVLRKRELIFEASTEIDEIVYLFNHALAQEVTYQSILTKTRRVLHQRVATAIEELFETQSENVMTEKLEALAYHYVEAGVDGKAIQYLTRSAKRMAENFNNSGAVASYLKAIEILERTPTEDPSIPSLNELYYLISDVHIHTGDLAAAEAFQRKLLEFGKSKNDPAHLVKSYRRLGDISRRRGHFDKALEHFHLSLDYAIKANDFEGQIRTYKGLANTWQKLNDFPKALDMFDKGIQGARTLGAPRLIAEYLNDKATVLIELHKLDEAQKHLEQTVEIAKKDSTLKSILISATLNLGVVEYFNKNPTTAMAKFQETAKMADQIGDLTNKLIAKHNLGEMLSEFKQYPEALREFEESLQIAKDVGNDLERVNNWLLIGHTKVKMGAIEEGKNILREGIDEALARKFWNYYCNGLLCLADAHIETGETEKARSALETTLVKATELNNVLIIKKCEEDLHKLAALKNVVPIHKKRES